MKTIEPLERNKLEESRAEAPNVMGATVLPTPSEIEEESYEEEEESEEDVPDHLKVLETEPLQTDPPSRNVMAAPILNSLRKNNAAFQDIEIN
jgi:hypothetical protein